jgi:ATP-dependent DNA helicase RecG
VPAADKPRFLERAWERVREEVAQGRQAYVVCPRIGENLDEGESAPQQQQQERRQALAVLDVAAELDSGPLHGLRNEILHGRLAPEEKDRVMREFAAGRIDVLVATTVIEVGVDVPNATVMVVMDAERFGVSQLHQLRGRVGRGQAPGLCLLVTEAMEETPSRQRLEAVAATVDGFKLARLDLEQRREGDVLGATQAGRQSSLRLLRLLADEDLITLARDEAAAVVTADPDLAAHPAIKTAIEDLLGDQDEYLDKT